MQNGCTKKSLEAESKSLPRPDRRGGPTLAAKSADFALLRNYNKKSLIDDLYQALCLLRLRFHPFWDRGQRIANLVHFLAAAEGQVWCAASARAQLA